MKATADKNELRAIKHLYLVHKHELFHLEEWMHAREEEYQLLRYHEFLEELECLCYHLFLHQLLQ